MPNARRAEPISAYAAGSGTSVRRATESSVTSTTGARTAPRVLAGTLFRSPAAIGPDSRRTTSAVAGAPAAPLILTAFVTGAAAAAQPNTPARAAQAHSLFIASPCPIPTAPLRMTPAPNRFSIRLADYENTFRIGRRVNSDVLGSATAELDRPPVFVGPQLDLEVVRRPESREPLAPFDQHDRISFQQFVESERLHL